MPGLEGTGQQEVGTPEVNTGSGVTGTWLPCPHTLLLTVHLQDEKQRNKGTWESEVTVRRRVRVGGCVAVSV